MYFIITHVDDNGNDVLVEKFEYHYHATGDKAAEFATDKDGNRNVWEWDYDTLGRLINERHNNHDDSLDYTAEYLFDLVGNRLEKTTVNAEGIEKIISAFDQNDRLLNEKTIFNSQDKKQTDYRYNGTEQVGKTVTDLATNKVESKTTMEYNEQGRMSKITIDTYLNGVLAKRIVQEYEYDASGIKVKQTESVDEDGNGAVDSRKVTEYLNDAMNHTGYSQVLEERTTENGGTVKVTTYTIGHDVLAQFNAAAGFLALLADGHGSTRAVADNNGTIVQQYNYDAYGNALGFDASQALTNLLYSGEQFNPVSGLQYLRARWYNPQSGTFNRLDPFAGDKESPLSFHKYAYTHNNPINGVDPSGEIMLLLLASIAFTSPLFAYMAMIGTIESSNNFKLMGLNEQIYLSNHANHVEKTLEKMVRDLANDPAYSLDYLRSFVVGYGEFVIDYRKDVWGKDEYYNTRLTGRYGNSVAVLSRAGFSFPGGKWGCKDVGIYTTDALKKLDTSNLFTISHRRGLGPLAHSYVQISTKDRKHSWVTTSWETGYPTIEDPKYFTRIPFTWEY